MKKEQPLVSVIVPVYNVEEFLSRCLDSIVSQTYRNIEIILVNDGSTDGSKKVCEDYARKDRRIRVFNKKNEGAATARNYGIKKSKGEYVTFIDSDDTVTSNYVDDLYSGLDSCKTKLSISSYSTDTKLRTTNYSKTQITEALSTEDALRRMLTNNGFTVASWAKMYHRSLFKNVQFPDGKIYEDDATTYKLIMLCPEIAYIDKSLYNYNVREHTVTSKKFTIEKMAYIIFTDQACSEILKVFPNLKNECEARRAVARFSILRQMLDAPNLSEEERAKQAEIEKYLRANYRKLLRNPATDKKTKLSLPALMLNKKILKTGAHVYERLK